MQSRSGLKMIAVAASILAAVTLALAGGIATQTFLVTEDSAKSTTWTIGSSAARADFDTSYVYDAQRWDNLTMQVKFRPLAPTSSADSGAVTIVLQMSNDQLYWTPVDSALAADSLASFKNVTVQRFRYARFIGHHAVKTDSAGVSGTITVNARGQW